MESNSSSQPNQQPLASGQQKDQLHSASPTISYRPSKIFIILMVVLLILTVGAGGYILGANKQSQTPQLPTQSYQSLPKPTATLTLTPDETANWKTYSNEKYGFKIKYPNSWKVTTRGQGEAISATGNEDTFSIRDGMIEGKGISFDIASLGSERLGSYYSSAKNLDDYTNLIAKKDEKGIIIRRFVKESTVDNRRSLWFEIYEWKVDKQVFVWTPEIYFQDKNNIYQVSPSGAIDLGLLNQILSTFRFIENEKEILGLPWKSVCAEIDNKPFMVSPEKGQGITHIGRKAVQDYINQANLLGIPDKFPSILTTQRVYAEDYIKDYLVSKGVSASNNIEIPCELVEVALMASTKLTPAQQENLEAYARRSIGLSRLREIQEIIEKATEGTLKPYIIVAPKSIN